MYMKSIIKNEIEGKIMEKKFLKRKTNLSKFMIIRRRKNKYGKEK